MQHIFHHNSSGNNAFTGDLLTREVLRATSLHPVKQHKYQYRLHNFLNQRKIIDLRHRYVELKREVFKLRRDLLGLNNINDSNQNNFNETTTKNTTENNNFEVYSEFESFILNKNENLSLDLLRNRFLIEPTYFKFNRPLNRKQQYDFDFFTRSLFSSTYISPKRGLEGYWKRSVADTVRQIMDEINSNGKERGRIIDFKDILYGYMRHHPLYGLDYIIDILLIYRKYEGRKMTVPVRRHAYVRNSYSGLMFREDNLEHSIYAELPKIYKLKFNNANSDHQKVDYETNSTLREEISEDRGGFLRNFLGFLFPFFTKTDNTKENEIKNKNKDFLMPFVNQTLGTNLNLSPNFDQKFYINNLLSAKTINFVLPLTGRWDIFKRFMTNYENTCLKTDENTKLVIVLFENDYNTGSLIQDEHTGRFIKQSILIQNLIDYYKAMYPRKVTDETLILKVTSLKFSRSIGCEMGAALFKQEDLLFFIDVDILFTNEFLFRARLNTIQYKQVYYPIVFSEYDPDDSIDAIQLLVNKTESSKLRNRGQKLVRNSHYELNLDNGYWRQFGFGIVSVYYSDLKLVGGFDTSIIGWGKEDVDLYEKFIRSNLTIFRTIDPGLIHVFHKIECDASLVEEQMIMCMGSKSTSIASQRVLANLVYEKQSHLIKPVQKQFNNGSKFITTQKMEKSASRIRSISSIEKNV
jgi:chondroitin sulfate synthase